MFARKAHFTSAIERRRRIIDHLEAEPTFCAGNYKDSIAASMVSLTINASTAEGGPVDWLEGTYSVPWNRALSPCWRATAENSHQPCKTAGCLAHHSSTDKENHGVQRFYQRAEVKSSKMQRLRSALRD
ncbi:hypothetical protein RP726_01980 [Candidatus Methylospira mobilis]|uniref:hypothetical protein n=1 Tax=Candidatus Methylospira mobilis TaxID=1808979 RepID=UPI0028E7B260|nr:hypothetical protein [Candidatus Methylospira mobilis]WNV05191.1 hypothetical protein RP726_01980 [Candidatus Methylospira mobilis]